MPSGFRRRKTLQILAAGSGLALLGRAARAEIKPHVWRGIALGAQASITLYHADAAMTQQALSAVTAEIRRLEQEFSLYRPDSELCRLNRQGYLDQPSIDMLRLLSEAHAISELTEGAFDISVQPLWEFYRNLSGTKPESAELASVVGKIGYRAINIQAQRIRLNKPGMALTLNGIAQGYITDRVAERLQAMGFASVLLDLGEIRALGAHPGGRTWHIGISDPQDKTRLIEHLALRDQAVASSAGISMRFDPTGQYHHLFDPRNGRCRHYHDSVSVIASTATLADSLATAFYQMPLTVIRDVLTPLKSVRVVLHQVSGAIQEISSNA